MAAILRRSTGGKRLGHVVVDAQVVAAQLIRLVVQRRQHDHGHAGAAADPFADAKAIQLGQHQVEQHQIERGSRKGVQRLQSILSRHHRIPCLSKPRTEHFQYIQIVLHDEYAPHTHTPFPISITHASGFFLKTQKKRPAGRPAGHAALKLRSPRAGQGACLRHSRPDPCCRGWSPRRSLQTHCRSWRSFP